ncbi:MAG: signal recognition particle-docking protein FtsY [Rhodospirillaceae bacterium]|jgi:fused signal recognition particle receptor|nr:signal recognition particle-docking protein FtsY [Rhodospirillaceae bacterium]MBT4590109.1 signal recognition particle-docking protein FtsY [Rhodospirillaceae bacterium]MBT7266549.1 signal recognition particle-docking protein FtsY [Rhodospirillaceae bacterium]
MTDEAKRGWLSRLKDGLSRSSSALTQGINDLFTKRKLDDAAIEELEEILITSDLGVATAARLTQSIAASRFDQEVSAEEIRGALAEEIATILEPIAQPLEPDSTHAPHVIIVCGVNGVGKTTTIGKLAQNYSQAGKKVVLAAGDTFRAAAIEQLKVWGERTNCPVIATELGKDAASLAYDALEQAKAMAADILLIDTAGRLQNRKELMAELEKIIRVIRKIDDTAPHSCLLVLDATTGQNAHSQVEIFAEMVDVTGLIVTKLDGSSKGGVLVSLAEKFGLPVHAIGVGEQVDDMRPFQAQDFARSLMGLDS